LESTYQGVILKLLLHNYGRKLKV